MCQYISALMLPGASPIIAMRVISETFFCNCTSSISHLDTQVAVGVPSMAAEVSKQKKLT